MRIDDGEVPTRAEYRRRFPGQGEDLDVFLSELSLTDTISVDVRLLSTDVARNEEPANEDGSAEAPPPVEAAPMRLGRYVLESVLGTGTYGQVFLAFDEELHRRVAVKVPHVGVPGGASGADSHVREARMAASLDHPHIVPVYDVGDMDDGRWYVVSKFVEGCTLKQRMKRGGVAHDEGATIVARLADALHHAHKADLVHRDVKPANILLDRTGQPLLTDFGLALAETEQRARKGEFSGTPAYMSPEQVRGETQYLDGRTDIWSLGVVLYELLTGRRPFRAPTRLELFDEIKKREPKPPRMIDDTIPRELERICLQCLAKDIKDRYTIAGDVAEELAACTESAVGRPSRSIPAESGRAAQRAPTPATDPERRFNVYLSHTDSDSSLVTTLAGQLESRGYSTWFYERDAVAGVSYDVQCEEAVAESDATVLVITRRTLGAFEVARDLQRARPRGRLLPVLEGLSESELRNGPPHVREGLEGVDLFFEVRNDDVAYVADGIASTLDGWGVAARSSSNAGPGNNRSPARPAEPSRISKVWATDANMIDIGDLKWVVFENRVVQDFLGGGNRFFLSANKGLGKTLLLTFQRNQLTERYQADSAADAAVRFIPEGRPYLDFMTEMPSLRATHERFLSDLGNAKRVWALALRVAVLSHHRLDFGSADRIELEQFPQRLRMWVEAETKVQPTVVFKELVSHPLRDIHRLLDRAETFLEQSFRSVHGATYLFVDKVDQGVRTLGQAAWINVQAALLEAAWELMNGNSHVKVYASIRQEAFANYESDLKTNLFGSVTPLQYSDADLEQLLDQLTRCYEHGRTFKEFVGVNVVRRPHAPFPEDSFRFVRRHTLGRPRDLVILASELSRHEPELSEPTLRRLVPRTAASMLVGNVFDEMQVFLDCLRDRSERTRFLALLPHNVLTRDEAIRVYFRFNEIDEEHAASFDLYVEGMLHPFWELYSAGLLGVVARDPDSGRTFQRFKQPHDAMVYTQSALPDVEHYFLHPALNHMVDQSRSDEDYRVFRYVTVGHDCDWPTYAPLLLEIERELHRLRDDGLAEIVYRVLNVVVPTLADDGLSDASLVLGRPEWEHLRTRLDDERLADLGLWIEELVGLPPE